MPYEPTLIPESDIKDLVQALNLELLNIANDYNLPLIVQLDESHAEPVRPRLGMVVLADGTDWDPGAGAGVYAYYNSVWNPLSSGTRNSLRVTGTTTLTLDKHTVFGDTDGGAFTITLPAGIKGKEYRIINVGSSGNALTLAPNGSEEILGVNSNFTLLDGDVLIIGFDTTEGWW